MGRCHTIGMPIVTTSLYTSDITPKLIASFDKRVRKDSVYPGCWRWVGGKEPAGYGKCYVSRLQASVRAHRISFIRFKGEIPEGLCILHKCNQRDCVNPNHLYAGTQLENAADRLETVPKPRRTGKRKCETLSCATIRWVVALRKIGHSPHFIASLLQIDKSFVLDVLDKRNRSIVSEFSRMEELVEHFWNPFDPNHI